jgi:hypothetical protein
LDCRQGAGTDHDDLIGGRLAAIAIFFACVCIGISVSCVVGLTELAHVRRCICGAGCWSWREGRLQFRIDNRGMTQCLADGASLGDLK